MHFFLESGKFGLDKEIYDLKYILSMYGNKYIHEYDEISEKDIEIAKFGNGVNVPVGSLGFVSAFLKNVKGNGYMKPLEIPRFLRKEEYLKRYYDICGINDLPSRGSYFIKDASYLKSWEANVFFMPFIRDTVPKVMEDWEEHEYVCSEVLDLIYAEYRVLIHEDVVVGVQYYSGLRYRGNEDIGFDYVRQDMGYGTLYFPDSDMIKSIVRDIKDYRKENLFPRSYTLDVAITSRGTVLLEVHNFVSCGTYGFCDKVLPDMYRNGIEYELER